MNILGIDVGGSGSRARFAGWTDPLLGERAAVTAQGSTMMESAAALMRRAASADHNSFSNLDAIGIGATGLGTLIAEPETVVSRLRSIARECGAPKRLTVTLAIDAVCAHLGALGGASGAVVALGTGAIALGGDGTRWRRIDGWGHLLGDRGSGAWIGGMGLRIALEAFDELSPHGSALLERARERFGAPLSWPRQLYTRDDRAGVLASFAIDVISLADAGDAAATRIAERGAADAARSVLSAAEGFEPRVCALGGIVSSSGIMRTSFEREIARVRPDVEVVLPLGSVLDGAIALGKAAPLSTDEVGGTHVWSARR